MKYHVDCALVNCTHQLGWHIGSKMFKNFSSWQTWHAYWFKTKQNVDIYK